MSRTNVENFSNTLLERLKEAENTRNVSAFARKIGMNQKTVDFYLKGERKPSLEFLYCICSSLGISADYLLGLVDDPHGTSSGSVISAPNNRGSIAQNSPGATVTSGTDCANCARVLKLQAQLEVLKDLLRKG